MLRSISLTVTATFIGQLLNFAVDILIADNFGTSWAADAYFLSLIVSLMVVDIFVLGINAVFVPAYVKRQKTGQAEGFFSASLNAATILAFLVCAVIYLLTPWLIDVVADGFTRQGRVLAVTLTRVLLALVVTTPIAVFMSSRLNAHGRFFLPGLGKSFNFVFIIVILLLFKDVIGISSLAAGYLLGSIVFISALVYLFYRDGLGHSFRMNIKEAQFKETGLLLLPLFASAVVNYCGILYERSIAAGLPEGSIAALSYAFKLVCAPSNLLILGAMSVVLPAFSRFAADDDIDGLAALLTKGMRLLSFLIVPTAVLLALLRGPLVSLMFERGAFTAASSALTSTALFYYVFGLCGMASVLVVSKIFLALKDIKTMSFIGIAVVALNVALLVMLTPVFGFIGIPLAFSITATVHIVVMLLVLQKKTGMEIIRPLLAPFARHLAAAAAMTAAFLIFMAPMAALVQMQTKSGQLVYLCAMTASGAVVYAASSFVLRTEEAGYFFERVNEVIVQFRA